MLCLHDIPGRDPVSPLLVATSECRFLELMSAQQPWPQLAPDSTLIISTLMPAMVFLLVHSFPHNPSFTHHQEWLFKIFTLTICISVEPKLFTQLWWPGPSLSPLRPPCCPLFLTLIVLQPVSVRTCHSLSWPLRAFAHIFIQTEILTSSFYGPSFS